jgi:hypothetical protein
MRVVQPTPTSNLYTPRPTDIQRVRAESDVGGADGRRARGAAPALSIGARLHVSHHSIGVV